MLTGENTYKCDIFSKYTRNACLHTHIEHLNMLPLFQKLRYLDTLFHLKIDI